MSPRSSFLLLFLLGSISAFSQDSTRVERHFPFIADSLTPVSSLDSSQQHKVTKGQNMVFYDTKGKELDKMKVMERMQGGKMKVRAYVDPNLKIRAGILVEKQGGSMKKDSLQEHPDNPNGRNIPSRFEVDLLNGSSYAYTKKGQKDSILVLNFWFTACKPCKMEIPELNRMVEEFEGKAVRFQAITHNKGSKIRSFLQDQPFSYAQGVDARDLYKSFGIARFPAHIVVDRKGKVRFFKTGYTAGRVKALKKCIKGLLE